MDRAAFTWLSLLLATGSAHAQDSTPHVVENSPRLCQNGLDDDGDGMTDCDDDSCAQLIFCVARTERTESTLEECNNSEDDDGDGMIDCDDDGCAEACSGTITLGRPGTRGIYQPRVVERGPEIRYLEHDDPRRYPVGWATRPMTYLEGMLVPEVALITQPIRTSSRGDETLARLAFGVTYGLLDSLEITAVPVPLRLAPVFDYENPAVAMTVRMLDLEAFDLGLYANVGIPIGRSPANDFPEPNPLASLGSRSRFYDVAHLDVGLRGRIRVADVLRIDLQLPMVGIVFASDMTTGELAPRADLTFLADFGVSITEYAYVGMWTGVFLQGPGYDAPRVPFGFFAGGVIPGHRRGPAADIGLRFGWPILYDGGARSGVDPVDPGFWQLTFDVRVFGYVLP